jgi:hypothetical protein
MAFPATEQLTFRRASGLGACQRPPTILVMVLPVAHRLAAEGRSTPGALPEVPPGEVGLVVSPEVHFRALPDR